MLKNENQLFLFIWITTSSNVIENIELWRIIGKDQNVLMKFDALVALIDGYWLVNNVWLTDINWPDHLTCSSYSVKRKTSWEALSNKSSNFTLSITSAAPYGRQWVKTYHIFCEQVMINLATFICDWVLISFKTFEMSPCFNNHLVICFFKVYNFFLTVVLPYARHKSFTNITPPFPQSYRTWATCFWRYYQLLSFKRKTTNVNYCTYFSVWQLYSATNVWHCKTFLGVNVKT